MEHASSCYLRWSIAGLLVALIGLGTPANAQTQRYSVTDLGTLGGGTSKGYGINARGQVTGEAVTTGGVFHAFQYAPGSGMIDLGTLGGGSSTGYAINASGQITGQAVTANGTLHAFLYTPGSGMTDLGTLGGGTSNAYGINASGQVTGQAVTAGGVFHAFVYTPGSGMTDLGTLGGGSSTGYAIDADGQVTGEAVTAGGVIHAFLYAKRGMRDLNSMIDPGIAAYVTLFSGKGINDGWIVANGVDSRTGQTHAYLLSKH
jgi:probable HAF family extracellular repeat protein